MNTAVIIPAAGTSRRYNAVANADPLAGERNKLDEDLGGRPVLQRTVELFTTRDDVGAVIVAGPADDDAFATFELRHGDRLRMLGATLCRGGAERWESVKLALAMVPDDATHVAVHDGARPVTAPALIDSIFAAAHTFAAVAPGVAVSDTLKRVGTSESAEAADPLAAILGTGASGGAGGGASARRVEATIDRADVVAVQTPQVFEASLLRRAYENPPPGSTDDAGLVEWLGEPVMIVEGDPLNLKITGPRDLPLVRAIGGYKLAADRPTHKKF